ncbi:MAG TPA: ATP-binding protein [Rhodocyclaceae bacterium]|nr:ATP-binding protein [Rhodocyclaceae bacterium]
MAERGTLTTGVGSIGSSQRRRLASLLAVAAMVLGGAVLGGWFAAVPQIPRLYTDWPAMQPLSAVVLILGGGALLLQAAHRFRLAGACIAVIALVAGSALYQYASGHYLGIDAFLCRDAVLAQVDDPYPGRMRTMNAVGLLLFCLAMALPRRRSRQYRWVARLATLGLVFPFATVCSYLLGAQGFSGLAGLVALSVPAAIGQVLLFGGILYRQRGRTWLQLLYGRTPGGRAARSLLPVILGWPLVVGVVINLSSLSIDYPHQVLALALVLVMVVLAALVLRGARRLDNEVAGRRAADAARRESEERYRTVVESANEGIVTMDRDCRIIFANPAAARIFGYSLAEMQGMELVRLMPEGARARFQAGMERYLVTGERRGTWRGVETTGLHRDGHEVPIEISYVEFRQAGQQLFTGIIHDISERKAAETKLRQVNESLEQRVRLRTAELSRVNEALMQSNQELQRFAYVASHDLQTPLRSITGFVQLLRQAYQGRLDRQADEWIGLVIDNTHRLQNLIQELLTYSRADSQAGPLEPTNLSQVFDDVVAALESEIQATGAEVFRDELPIVLGDRIQLGQVFLNLIDNAIKYRSAEPPRISVSARREHDEWLISVRDNGIGIAPKHHERIFEIFRRLHTQKAYPGLGTGLAICRRVIQRHGGRIWVESEMGKGSVFRFTLPVMAT